MILTIDQLPYHYQNLNLTELNCDALIEHQYLATLPVIIAGYGRLAIVLLILSFLLTVANFVIFIEQCVILVRRWPLRSYCTTVGILAVFPISSLCFFLTLLMPRSHDVNTTTVTLYQPLSLVLFYKLVVSYMGREKNLKDSLMNHIIPTKGPPLYWFCVCLPSTRMNKNLYYLMKACIYQLFMAPCLLYFVMGVCSKTGVYIAGQFSLENAAIYIVAFGALSFCVGIYCLEMFSKMARQVLPGYNISSKYHILQSYFVITRFHVLIFDSLGNNGLLPCLPPISGFVNGLYVRTFLLLIFSFLLSLMARHIFGRPAPNSLRSLDQFEPLDDSMNLWHDLLRPKVPNTTKTTTTTIVRLNYDTNTIWHQPVDGTISKNPVILSGISTNQNSTNSIIYSATSATNHPNLAITRIPDIMNDSSSNGNARQSRPPLSSTNHQQHPNISLQHLMPTPDGGTSSPNSPLSIDNSSRFNSNEFLQTIHDSVSDQCSVETIESL